MALRRWTPIVVASLFVLACGSSGGTDASPTTDPGPAPDDTAEPADVPVPGDAAEDAFRDVPPEDVPPPMDVPADVAPDVPVLSAECAAAQSGTNLFNTITVKGKVRKFLMHAPDGATGPGGKWPVIFLWHGFVGAATPQSQETMDVLNWHGIYMNPVVNDARMPSILVTPLSDGKAFLDWHIMGTSDDAPESDVDAFDAILACLDAKYGVDPDHVHSVGFSAGSILTDLLGVTRGDVLASTLTWSGGYLANPANDTGFGIYWPDPDPSARYPQVLFHGGTSDQWSIPGMFTAHFNQWTEADVPWLNGLHHDVILCTHTQGHTPPSTPSMTGYVVDFFKAHPRGTTTSPYAAGIPATFPATCTYHAATP